MTIIPLCVQCRHLSESAKEMVCTAFPDGIPRAILLAEHDHRESYQGDHGIHFEIADDWSERGRQIPASRR